MADRIPFAKRAAQAAVFTIGGGVALAIAFAAPASADEVVVQDADVTNAGVGAANSGGNVAVGNASRNNADSDQTANGGLVASNGGGASNSSDGSASVTSGSATAVGNESSTAVAQHAATPTAGNGLAVSAQDADVTNAGAGLANSGGNVAIGNASRNNADSDQRATGLIAANAGGASNSSDGSASIATGNATAIGNQSSTVVGQHAAGGHGSGLAVVLQDADVTNVGIGLANSGGNVALGNVSDNSARSTQNAFGLLAFNAGGASNHSDGTASIHTGDATGIGNRSSTVIDQGASVHPHGLALVVQSAPVLNAGLGIANSGLNGALGNGSLNQAILAQVSFGLLASNIGTASNWTDGFAFVLAGNATGIGNSSTTAVKQYSI